MVCYMNYENFQLFLKLHMWFKNSLVMSRFNSSIQYYDYFKSINVMA